VKQIQKIINTLKILPNTWHITPCIKKVPVGKNWNTTAFMYPVDMLNQLLSKSKIEIINKNNNIVKITPDGIALVCGLNDDQYIIAVDCDGMGGYRKLVELATDANPEDIAPIDDDNIRALSKILIPQTIAYSSGTPDHCQYLFSAAPSSNLYSRTYTYNTEERLELRGTGLGSTLPPSCHPSGRNYDWMPESSPQETQIAEAPDWLLKGMHRRITYQPSTVETYTNEEIIKLLWEIHPRFADDYHTWISVGKTLYALNPDLLGQWIDWSKQSNKFQNGVCDRKWETFATNNNRTISSLIYFVNQD
jgi:Bifunctional DNA primase/polymerase, N-terminal/Primase C terminal 2 (PriCT-2)